MAGRLKTVNQARAVASDALDTFDVAVADAVDAFLAERGRPTVADVADAAETILREAAHATRAGLSELGVDATVRLTETALSHLAFVRGAARKMISAVERSGARITDAQLRADFGALLAGDDVDMTRYGLTRGDVTSIRTVRSDGERLLTDQLFEATHTTALQDLTERGEEYAHWRLSPRHKDEDECDDLAAGGPYLVSNYPARPHPFCGCYPALVR